MTPSRRTNEEHHGCLLRPPKPDCADYDDDDALTEYIWRHYTHLLAAAEARAGLYTEPLDRDTALKLKGEAFADYLDRTHGSVTTSELNVALQDGRIVLFRRARDRILKEHGQTVFINRCPACGRIVRSPGARQCIWCNHDWHHGTSA